MEFGVEGLKKKYLNALNNTRDIKSMEFYKGVIILLDALLDFNDKHIKYYENYKNKELVKRIKKVPRYKAESFKEAVQSFYMQHLVVMRENPFGGNSVGRLDYYLWPYLKKDLEEEKCSLDEAKEIIDELFLRFEERLNGLDMWTEAIVVGGSDENLKSCVNPLTYIMIQSIMDLNILHPAVYIRIPIEYDQKLIDLSSEYILKSNNRAQILNDKSIIEMLINNNIPISDAVNYVCGGCMEIGIQGKQSDFMYAGWQNTLKMLELMITGGICLKTKKRIDCFNGTKGLINYDTFDDFYYDFIKEATRLTNISLSIIEIYSEYSAINRPSFLISSMIDDCLNRGRNMHDGGAKYHDYGGTHLGLPNLVDSLYAIKYLIFDNKILTKERLINALENNFLTDIELLNLLKNVPKYGCDNEEVDIFANKVMSDFSDMYLEYKTRFDGKGKPTILTFIHAPFASSILGATLDGNTSGNRIAQGITPFSSSMRNGITSAINSCCKMPYKKFYGGASSMWNIDSTSISKEILNAILMTFIQKKGMIFQGNTNAVEQLIEAKSNPHKFPNLFVRVGGYSARFIYLWPELQDEVINRMRHKK